MGVWPHLSPVLLENPPVPCDAGLVLPQCHLFCPSQRKGHCPAFPRDLWLVTISTAALWLFNLYLAL